MKIAICASLDFTKEIKKIADELKGKGFEITIPLTSELILNREVSLDEIKQEKENGSIWKRMIKYDCIRKNFERIERAEAILALNLDKNEIKNYIGGNLFLEIGFAYILNKKIFLLNPIPDISYKDEIKAMEPIILNGNLDLIKAN